MPDVSSSTSLGQWSFVSTTESSSGDDGSSSASRGKRPAPDSDAGTDADAASVEKDLRRAYGGSSLVSSNSNSGGSSVRGRGSDDLDELAARAPLDRDEELIRMGGARANNTGDAGDDDEDGAVKIEFKKKKKKMAIKSEE